MLWDAGPASHGWVKLPPTQRRSCSKALPPSGVPFCWGLAHVVWNEWKNLATRLAGQPWEAARMCSGYQADPGHGITCATQQTQMWQRQIAGGEESSSGKRKRLLHRRVTGKFSKPSKLLTRSLNRIPLVSSRIHNEWVVYKAAHPQREIASLKLASQCLSSVVKSLQ